MTDVSSPARARRAVTLLLAGYGLSLFGDGMFVVAIGFAVFAVGGGAGALGLVLVTGSMTMLALILPAGVLVDRSSRRGIVVGADIVRGVLQLATAAIVAWPGAHWGYLVLVAFVFGAASALHMPAASALVAEVIADEQLERINGAIMAMRGLGLVVGGAVAGFLIARVGPPPVIVIDACTFLACATCIFALGRDRAIRPEAPAAALPGHAGVSDLRVAINLLRATPWLAHGVMFTGSFVFVSYGPLQVIGPATARVAAPAVGIAGSELWGWISAATAVGMMAGGITAFVRPPAALMTVVRLSLVLGACGPAALALGVQPFATLPGFVALGGAMGLFTSGWESAKQSRVDQRMLARIGALDWFAQLSCMALGVTIAAAAASAFGPRSSMLGVGIGCVLLAIGMGWSPPLASVFRERALAAADHASGGSDFDAAPADIVDAGALPAPESPRS